VTQTAGLASGAAFPIGTTTQTYTAIDAAGNLATASFNVTVTLTALDVTAPVITIPNDITVTTAPGETTAVVSFATITALDDVDGSVTVTQTAGLASGAAFPIGTTTQTYTAIDAAGNPATASFIVTVNLNQVPVVVFADSFENPDRVTNWTQDQGAWFSPRRRGTDGSRSAEVDGPAVDAQLVSPVITVMGGTATVTFDWFIETTMDTGEYLAFDTSIDGGATWTERARLEGNVDPEMVYHNVVMPVTLAGSATLQLRFRATMNLRGEDSNVDNVIVTLA
jgi:hypothetical protein